MSDDDPLIGWSSATLRFDALLGRGAMGAVYRGVQLGLDRPVAIKVIAPHLVGDGPHRVRFTREAQVLGRLVHQNVITCHDVGTQRGPDGRELFVMVLEFVDGWSLGTLMRRRPPTVRQALELHAQAADGLAAAHGLGIIHRDIKPDNIMVTRREFQAKLADFGLAKGDDSALLTHTGAIMGSPAYMAPEACRGDAPGPSGDLYGLGCSLFHVLSGTPPYTGSSALVVLNMHMTAPSPRLSERRSDLAGLDKMMARCLGKVPAERAPDATTLAGWLRAAAKGVPEDLPSGKLAGSGTVAPPALRPTAQRASRRGPQRAEARNRPCSTAAPRRRGRSGDRAWSSAALAAAVVLCAVVLLARGGRQKAADPALSGGATTAAPIATPADTAAVVPVPPPAAGPPSAGRVLELLPGESLLEVWAPPPGSPDIPARIPAGNRPIQLSNKDTDDGLQHLRMRLPATRGRTGVVMVLSAGVATGRTLLVTVRTAGVARGLKPIRVVDDSWRRITIDCGEAGGDEVVVSCNGPQPLAVARALAWSGAPPDAATTAFTPGTLQPLGPIGRVPAEFSDVLGKVAVGHHPFPDPQRVRIAVSNQHLAANREALLTLTRGIANAWGADATATAAEAALLPYASTLMLHPVAESAVRAKAQVLVIVVGSEEAPKILPLSFGVAYRELIDGGVLPVLLLAPAGWQEPLRSKWAEKLGMLQEKFPQLPIIDLMEVPIGLARQDLPVDLHSSDVHARVAEGLAAGIAELQARIAWLARNGGVRAK